MEEYRPSTTEKKRAILDVTSLYDHPLVKRMQASIARANPDGARGKKIIDKFYDRMDTIITLATSIDRPHVIHDAAARYAPHRFHDAHALVQALEERPLSSHREHIEEIFRHAADSKAFMENGHAAISTLVEALIDYHLRARSDPIFAERISKLRKIVEKVPARQLAPLLNEMLHGSLAALGPHTIIDALAQEKDERRLVGKVSYLLKVARTLQNHPDGVRTLQRQVRRKVENVSLRDLIIYGLDSTAARRDAMRALKRRRKR